MDCRTKRLIMIAVGIAIGFTTTKQRRFLLNFLIIRNRSKSTETYSEMATKADMFQYKNTNNIGRKSEMPPKSKIVYMMTAISTKVMNFQCKRASLRSVIVKHNSPCQIVEISICSKFRRIKGADASLPNLLSTAYHQNFIILILFAHLYGHQRSKSQSDHCVVAAI